MKNSIQKLFFTLAASFFVFGIASCASKKEVSETAINAIIKESPAPEIKKTTESATVENRLSETVEKVKIGETEIQVVTDKTLNPTPLYFRPHENEITASDAAKEILKRHGGTFVELKSKGARLIDFSLKNKTYTFDPNRIFSAAGIRKTLKKNGNDTIEAEKEVSAFVNTLFSEFLTNKNLIIAVHNNRNGKPFSIKSYKGSPGISAININPNKDADDFFYVTNETDFKFFREKDFNVVLQNTAKAADDGSLSVYCGRQGISYINVESERGHLNEQIEMMEAMQEIVKDS